MSNQHPHDLQKLTHLVDTLKRVVLFDDYINIASATAQPAMVAPVFLDLSSYISATAEAALLSLFSMPNATAYWNLLVTTNNVTLSPSDHIQVYAGAISQWRTNYGIQTLINKGIYYIHRKLAGGGNGSFLLRLHGYIEPA
jgi:hypothetical protein